MSRRHDIALGALLADVGQLAFRAGLIPPASEVAGLRRELSPDGVSDAALLTAWALGRHFPGRDLAFVARAARPQSVLDSVVAVAKRHATSPSTTFDVSRLADGELDHFLLLRGETTAVRRRIHNHLTPRLQSCNLIQDCSLR